MFRPPYIHDREDLVFMREHLGRDAYVDWIWRERDHGKIYPHTSRFDWPWRVTMLRRSAALKVVPR